VKLLFPQDSMLEEFLTTSCQCRYIRFKCLLRFQPSDITTIKEVFTQTIMESLIDSSVYIRLLAAYALPRLLEMFPKSHSKIYSTVLDAITTKNDQYCYTTGAIALTRMAICSAELLEVAVYDVIQFCCIQLVQGSFICITSSRLNLLSKLITYLSSQLQYIDSQYFIQDYILCILYKWFQSTNANTHLLSNFPFHLFHRYSNCFYY
jgi:hypothetical protein